MIATMIDTNTIDTDLGLINQMHNAIKPEDTALLIKKDKLRSYFKYLRVIIMVSKPRKEEAIRDPIPAPTMPMCGMRIAFNIKTNTAVMLSNLITICVLPTR